MTKPRIVYTAGSFDMLHVNHLRMLEYAKGIGDVLIVGVNTDELISTYKSTPIIPFEERIALLRALKLPDVVVPQHSLDHIDKIKKLNFNAFVVGDDWAGKYDYLREHGVEVFYFPYGKGISSTSLKKKVYENFDKLVKKSENHFPADLAINKNEK